MAGKRVDKPIGYQQSKRTYTSSRGNRYTRKELTKHMTKEELRIFIQLSEGKKKKLLDLAERQTGRHRSYPVKADRNDNRKRQEAQKKQNAGLQYKESRKAEPTDCETYEAYEREMYETYEAHEREMYETYEAHESEMYETYEAHESEMYETYEAHEREMYDTYASYEVCNSYEAEMYEACDRYEENEIYAAFMEEENGWGKKQKEVKQKDRIPYAAKCLQQLPNVTRMQIKRNGAMDRLLLAESFSTKIRKKKAEEKRKDEGKEVWKKQQAESEGLQKERGTQSLEENGTSRQNQQGETKQKKFQRCTGLGNEREKDERKRTRHRRRNVSRVLFVSRFLKQQMRKLERTGEEEQRRAEQGKQKAIRESLAGTITAKRIRKQEYRLVIKAVHAFGAVIVKIVAVVLSALAPVLTVVSLILFLAAVIVMLFVFLLGINEEEKQNAMGNAQVSAECERYRESVKKYAEQYEIPQFVEVLLAIMMQESGGRHPDVMQSSQCGYNTRYPRKPNAIPDPDYSIACGVQAFKDALQKAGCETPADLEKLKLSLQAYNFGSGYVTWAVSKYGGYTEENAGEFSDLMAAKYGVSRYGDKKYVEHVLRYYSVKVGDYEAGTVEALFAEGEKYLGYPYVFGGSIPETSFDCSGFICWVFTKSGVYQTGRLTAQGLYHRSTPVPAGEELPGDLVFFTGTYDAGVPVTHVGIVAGDGSMLHCGSSFGVAYTYLNTAYYQSHFYGYGRLGKK